MLCTTMVCMCVCAKALFVWLLYVCTYLCDMSSCVRSLGVVQFVCCTYVHVCEGVHLTNDCCALGLKLCYINKCLEIRYWILA